MLKHQFANSIRCCNIADSSDMWYFPQCFCYHHWRWAIAYCRCYYVGSKTIQTIAKNSFGKTGMFLLVTSQWFVRRLDRCSKKGPVHLGTLTRSFHDPSVGAFKSATTIKLLRTAWRPFGGQTAAPVLELKSFRKFCSSRYSFILLQKFHRRQPSFWPLGPQLIRVKFCSKD